MLELVKSKHKTQEVLGDELATLFATPPPEIPKDCFPSAERNDVKKQLSDCKDVPPTKRLYCAFYFA